MVAVVRCHAGLDAEYMPLILRVSNRSGIASSQPKARTCQDATMRPNSYLPNTIKTGRVASLDRP